MSWRCVNLRRCRDEGPPWHVSPIIKLRCKLGNGQTARIKTETPGTIENIFRACLSARAPHSPCVFSRFFQRFTAPFQRERCNDPRPTRNEALVWRARVDGEMWKRKHGRSVTIERRTSLLSRENNTARLLVRKVIIVRKKVDSIKFNFSL